jgi:hypothetical protein
MASFIRIQDQVNIDTATGIGFLINPEKIVSVQSDSGDPAFTRVSFTQSKSNLTDPPDVIQLEIDATIPAASTGFPVTEAMNKAIETAILTPGTVVSLSAVLKSIAVDGTIINEAQVTNP